MDSRFKIRLWIRKSRFRFSPKKMKIYAVHEVHAIIKKARPRGWQEVGTKNGAENLFFRCFLCVHDTYFLCFNAVVDYIYD